MTFLSNTAILIYQADRVFWRWQFLEVVPNVGLKNASNQVVTNFWKSVIKTQLIWKGWNIKRNNLKILHCIT